MNVEAGDAYSFRDWLAAAPLRDSVKGTLNRAERWDVAAAGLVTGAVSAMAASVALAAQAGDGPTVVLAAALAVTAATGARAVTRLRQGRAVKRKRKADSPMVTYTSPDGTTTVQVTPAFDARIVEFAADPTGATWSAGLWDWITGNLQWLKDHAGFMRPIGIIIPLPPTPMPARPPDNDA